MCLTVSVITCMTYARLKPTYFLLIQVALIGIMAVSTHEYSICTSKQVLNTVHNFRFLSVLKQTPSQRCPHIQDFWQSVNNSSIPPFCCFSTAITQFTTIGKISCHFSQCTIPYSILSTVFIATVMQAKMVCKTMVWANRC